MQSPESMDFSRDFSSANNGRFKFITYKNEIAKITFYFIETFKYKGYPSTKNTFHWNYQKPCLS